MQDIWNQRYAENEFVYGLEPNAYFAEHLKKIEKTGKILLPAEGEGRNAIYAAQLGWDVDAFDFSNIAKDKALKLAENKNVKINYWIQDIISYKPEIEYYDVIALIYNHLTEDTRKIAHQNYIQSLKKGGKIIFEAFSKAQIVNTSGGPKTLELLYNIDEIKLDFCNLNIISLTQEDIFLNEGKLHQGKGNVIRMLAYKDL